MQKITTRTGTGAFLLLALLLFLQPAIAKPLENYKWLEASSEHFVVRSLTGKSATVGLLRNLEMLRAAIQWAAPSEDDSLPSPDMIYVVQNIRELYEIGYSSRKRRIVRLPPFDGHGYVTDENGLVTLVVIDENLEGVRGGFIERPRTYDLFHKYFWYVLDSDEQPVAPHWYKAGLAQYYAFSRERFDKFEMGRGLDVRPLLVDSRAVWHGIRFTVPELLMMSRSEHAALDSHFEQVFHLQSWLLIHYLLNNEDNAYPLPEGMSRYEELISGGGDVVTSFETAFDQPVENMLTRLDDYVKLSCCAYIAIPVDELLPEFSPQVSRISREQASLGLAQLAVALDRSEPAEHWYTVALEDDATKQAAEQGLAALRAAPERQQAR